MSLVRSKDRADFIKNILLLLLQKQKKLFAMFYHSSYQHHMFAIFAVLFVEIKYSSTQHMTCAYTLVCSYNNCSRQNKLLLIACNRQ